MVWDVTCVDTMAASHLQKSSKQAGSAANEAENNKIKKYSSLRQYEFCPLGFETTGVLGKFCHKLVKEIGAKVAEKTGKPRSTEFLLQRLSIEIQRGNAAAILATIPCTQRLDEIFWLF